MSQQTDLVIARNALAEFFSVEEIEDVCFEMGLDYQNVRRETKLVFARELVLYCKRSNIMPELYEVIKNVRPHSLLPNQQQIHIPNTLPQRQSFYGRQDVLNHILQILSPDSRTWGVVIDGIGGIGKTALAIEAAYLCKEKNLFDAFVFVSAKRLRLEPSGIKREKTSVSSLDDFINEIAYACGRSDIARLSSGEKVRGLRAQLREVKTLLIFDNVESLTKEEQEDIAGFLISLPNTCKAILTSRRRGGEGAFWLRLEPLDYDAATEIIKDQIKLDIRLQAEMLKEQPRWRTLIELSGGLPLALIWSIGLMRLGTWNFDKLVNMLTSRFQQQNSDLKKFIFERANQDLNYDEITILRVLSFFAAPARFEAIAQISRSPRKSVESALERLQSLSLIDSLIGKEKYSLHPLIRGFVQENLLAAQDEKEKISAQFIRYWSDYVISHGGSGRMNRHEYSHLESEWENIKNALEECWVSLHSAYDRFVEGLHEFLWVTGRWDDRYMLCSRGYEIAIQVKELSIAGWRAHDAAWIFLDVARNDLENARLWTNRCLVAWKNYKGHTNAHSLHLKGMLARQETQVDQSRTYFLEALKAAEESGDHEVIGMVLNSLGELEMRAQNFPQAKNYFHRAFLLDESDNDQHGQAIRACNLGELALVEGEIREATVWFDKALVATSISGRLDVAGKTKLGLARVYYRQGEPKLGIEMCEKAVEIFRGLQHNDLAQALKILQDLEQNATN